jgi:hypothetical protein
MSNNGIFSQIGGYYTGAKDWTIQQYDVYESGRKSVETYIRKKVSQENGSLVARITNCASEILIDLCALTGVLVLPAALLFTAKRAYPLSKYVMEYFKSGATPDTRLAAKEALKEEYKKSLHTTMGPAILVALAVHTVFMLTYGILALKGTMLFRGVALSLLPCVIVYKFLTTKRDRIEPPEADLERPILAEPEQHQDSQQQAAVAIPVPSAPMEECQT